MPQEVRIWHIFEDDRLREYAPSRLNLEARIETWLEQDISVLSAELMVIGRQVETDFGGLIDLLCLDPAGDVVLVELKRDKTAREVVAQILDYASWINELSGSAIIRIADAYLGRPHALERTFRERYGVGLPDTLNSEHRMIIVASDIDDSSERIIRYLSSKHGVSLNAATFSYFKHPDDGELLARVFLIEPSQVEYQSRKKSASKRLPNLTYEELEEAARQAGVEALYGAMVEGLGEHLSKYTTRSSIGFSTTMDGSRMSIFTLHPSRSTPKDGLYFQLYRDRFQRLFAFSEEELTALLPNHREPVDAWHEGIAGYFETREQVDRFLDGTVHKKAPPSGTGTLL